MSANNSVRASVRDPYSDAPDISPEHPLVCNRQTEFATAELADPEKPIHRQYTLAQRWMASKGFHPRWWLPEPLAAQWKTIFYPLKATPESVAQWQRLVEQVADGQILVKCAANANGSRQKYLADLQHDLKLLEKFDSKLIAFGPSEPGPGSNQGLGST
jgi:hypothetical protein